MLDKFLYKLIDEISYRNKTGIVNLQNEDDIYILSEILTEWGWGDIKGELIQNLLEKEERTFKNPILDKEVEYTDEEGNEKTEKVGNIMNQPEGSSARKTAEKYLPDEGSEEREKINKELGGDKPENKPQNDKDDKDSNTDDSDEEPAGESNTSVLDSDYVENLPDGDPAKQKRSKEVKTVKETLESIGILLNEASIFDDKYGIGSRFISINNTESLFKDGLDDKETVPKGYFTKVPETDDAVPVNIGGNVVVFVKADDTKKTYRIQGSSNKLRSMFGKMRKGATPNDINWNTDVLETAAVMGVFTNGYSVLKQLNDNVKTDDDLPNVIDNIKKQVSKAFGKTDDYASISEIESKIDKMHLADWYQLASLMAGMTKFTDDIIPNWSSKYVIHKSINKYYNYIDRSDLVSGTKQNTADVVISNTPISELFAKLKEEMPVKFYSNGICYIPDTGIEWIQVSLKKSKGGAQLGKIYSFLKDKFNLIDNKDILDIALEEGISDFVKKGKEFLKNIGTSFLEKLKSFGSFVSKIGSKISNSISVQPKKEIQSLEKELRRAGLKGSINEVMLHEQSMFDTLSQIGKDNKLLGVLVDNVNRKFDKLNRISKKNNLIWMTTFKKLSTSSPQNADTVGKILSNYQGASVIESMVGNIDNDSKTLYKNLIELEKEMIYGKTTLPLYKVFGMDFNDTSSAYKKFPGSEEFVQNKLGKDIDDVVAIFIRVSEQRDYYTLTVYALNDIDEDSGKFQYVEYRIGTNASGRYSFNFEGVKFIEMGKIKQRLNIK